jgi:hypothetical protein
VWTLVQTTRCLLNSGPPPFRALGLELAESFHEGWVEVTLKSKFGYTVQDQFLLKIQVMQHARFDDYKQHADIVCDD